ncbi:MAG: TolC family protein [Gemmatimonadaceae bacterium]
MEHEATVLSTVGRPAGVLPVVRSQLRLAVAYMARAAVVALAAGPLAAQSGGSMDTVRLTQSEVRTRALRSNPELLAVRLDTAIARGSLRQASLPLRFNPVVEALGARGGNGMEAAVSLEIEAFGQRAARVDGGRAGLARADASVANAARLTIVEADRTFYRLVAATRRVLLADEVLSLNQRLADVAKRQLAAGEISRLDYNLAVVEFGRSRSRALASRREQERTVLELERLIGLPRGTPIDPLLDPSQHTEQYLTGLADSAGGLDAERLTKIALNRRPDVAEQVAAARQAGSTVTLAQREALPNIVVRAASEPLASGSGRAVRPGLGLSLPIFNLNRGEVAARRAAARQAELARLAMERRVGAEVASAVASYKSAALEVDVLESTVLGPARQNRQLSETAYREGEIGLPVLLLIRNQVIDAELEYWTAWLAERESLAALLAATGHNLLPVSEVSR